MSSRANNRRRSGGFPGRNALVAGAAIAVVLLALITVGPAAWIFWRTHDMRYSAVTAVPATSVALVFGAGLQSDGSPTPILADRVHAAVLLYRAGKVRRLLLSGDGTSPGHDEPAAMARQAEAEGVPVRVIQRDDGGLRTYDTCARAHDLFGVREAVVVSQSYHLPRAIYTCRALGIAAIGFSFARVGYGNELDLRVRELVSLDLAWWSLHTHLI